jgi:3-isopropylmalate/(R)-2-methylmalate dehydratase small subunit
MEALERIDAVALPFPVANVDTDQIVPARFLARSRENIGNALFFDLRFDDKGMPRPDFVLNRPAYSDARIIVALENFGCGSSREAAVWALAHSGFRVAIAPTFGDIFFGNCFKNAMLPVVLPVERIRALLSELAAAPGAYVRIDLHAQTVSGPKTFEAHFEIDPFLKESLLTGRDELAMTLGYLDRILAFEASHPGPFDPRKGSIA